MKFVSVVHPAVSFPSYYESKRSATEAECQTELTTTAEFGENFRTHDEKEVQTDNFAQSTPGKYDEARLSAFVSRVAPAVMKELEKNSKSTAFLGYELLDRDDGRPHLSSWLMVDNCRISGVDWNPRGTRIVSGVAGRSPHEDWCKHSGSVQVWSVSAMSDGNNRLTGPSLTKTTSSCVTCVAFHPTEVNIVSAGTYNGEVLVWDLNREEDVPMASSAKHLGSEVSEAVTCLTFMKKNFLGEAGATHLSLLASGGLDGKLFLWAVNPVSEEMRLLKRFVLPSYDLVPFGVDATAARDSEVGITCWDFCEADQATFVIGGEGGLVAVCSMLSSKLAARTADGGSDSWKNPVSLSLQSHVGNVSGVAFSPSSGEILASVSNDGNLKIYNLKNTTVPVVEIQLKRTISRLSWSYSRPLVLFLGTDAGSVVVMDLVASRTDITLDLSLKNAPGMPDAASGFITSMMLSRKSLRMLCIGLASGAAVVWKLPEKLVNPTVQEASIFREIFEDQLPLE